MRTRNIGRFWIRPFEPADAGPAAAVVASAYSKAGRAVPDAPGLATLAQTGSALLVAAQTSDGLPCGVASYRDDEGVLSVDLLASARAGAGRALLRAVEMEGQDRGFRLVRCACEDDDGLTFLEYFGYRAMARLDLPGRDRRPVPALQVERRVPLLTIREQRRADAGPIAAITGEDTWFLAERLVQGWFVAADGETVVGAIHARTGRDGRATLTTPCLKRDYRGRGLEKWMLERAALYAATTGASVAETAVGALSGLDGVERELEDAGWERRGDIWARVLSALPLEL